MRKGRALGALGAAALGVACQSPAVTREAAVKWRLQTAIQAAGHSCHEVLESSRIGSVEPPGVGAYWAVRCPWRWRSPGSGYPIPSPGSRSTHPLTCWARGY